ncbi:TonB-dependent receptor plug domain-containing protein [Paracoccus sp. DMF-8]|uniref:TonB-dependent siderophore receptor n=1 Tax=Paracoccus sp. DMF-8 TaxID=3019445 RepID=UPI0023E87EE5|nr:TonB-dependent receptor plug domain-containing protein [Paracoccus sp. DMF-8]MDF3605823.1 TonB-dependent receptor plug domain-containing protein [Paracoccus sp. DMF-8]
MAKMIRIPQDIRGWPACRVMAGLMASTLAASGGLAQDADPAPDTIVLDTVYIHGRACGRTANRSRLVRRRVAKTPTEIIDARAQVSVVTAEELKTRAPNDLMQALSYTSSVTTDEYGSDNRYDFFRIRGFSAGGVYRDGLPLRTFNFTGGRIEPYSVEHIEVLKGATSTLFGLNAPGGLINVITKRPLQDPFGEVYTSVGEDHAEIGIDTGAPLDAEGVWTYRLTAKWQDLDRWQPGAARRPPLYRARPDMEPLGPDHADAAGQLLPAIRQYREFDPRGVDAAA